MPRNATVNIDRIDATIGANNKATRWSEVANETSISDLRERQEMISNIERHYIQNLAAQMFLNEEEKNQLKKNDKYIGGEYRLESSDIANIFNKLRVTTKDENGKDVCKSYLEQYNLPPVAERTKDAMLAHLICNIREGEYAEKFLDKGMLIQSFEKVEPVRNQPMGKVTVPKTTIIEPGMNRVMEVYATKYSKESSMRKPRFGFWRGVLGRIQAIIPGNYETRRDYLKYKEDLKEWNRYRNPRKDADCKAMFEAVSKEYSDRQPVLDEFYYANGKLPTTEEVYAHYSEYDAKKQADIKRKMNKDAKAKSIDDNKLKSKLSYGDKQSQKSSSHSMAVNKSQGYGKSNDESVKKKEGRVVS